MQMSFDMELLYSIAPKSTLHTLRERLESGKSIFEIINECRCRHGLSPTYVIGYQKSPKHMND